MKNLNTDYNLFLDDERFPYVSNPELDDVSAFHYTNYEPFKKEDWIIVRNYNDFVKEVEKRGLPKKCSFDHDLGDVSKIKKYDNFLEKTGYDCAKWLCDYCQDNELKFPEYFIHSMNPTGANNIRTYIENYKKHVEL
jgi:hypothetical protein